MASPNDFTLRRAIRTSLSDHKDFSDSQKKIYRDTFFAYIFGNPYEMTYRTTQLDEQLFEDVGYNKFFKTNFATSWQSQGSAPAPNNTTLYSVSWLNLKEQEQVLSVPEIDYPNYYIMQFMDSATNAVASIGPRTSPSYGKSQEFLIVGPDSSYYDQDIWSADIETVDGTTTLPIIRSGTNITWVVMRQFVNGLDVGSIEEVYNLNSGNEQDGGGFQLASLSTYQEEGKVPWEAPNSDLDTEGLRILLFGSAPNQSAYRYFKQMGRGLRKNPIPIYQNLGESETGVSVPSYTLWQGSRNPDQTLKQTADDWYEATAMDELNKKRIFRRLSSIGLSEKGFNPAFDVSKKSQLSSAYAFRAAYRDALKWLQGYAQDAITGRKKYNYWGPNNDGLGSYNNSDKGFVTRAIAVIEGGSANAPVDATYPTANYDSDKNKLISTYNYSLTIPVNNRITKPSEDNPSAQILGPASGVTSMSIYQVNDGYAYSPNIIANSINNKTYTPVETIGTFVQEVIGGQSHLAIEVDKPFNFLGDSSAGMAMIFSEEDAGDYDLQSDEIYYLKEYIYQDSEDKISFIFSDNYDFNFNRLGINGTAGIPKPGTGSVGDVVVPDAKVGDTIELGFINPVATLGNYQLSVNEPKTGSLIESDNNIVIDLNATDASVENPENWLPSPQALTKAAAGFQLMARYYYPNQSGDLIQHPRWHEGSVLPKDPSYVPPAVERGSLARLNTWGSLDQDLLDAKNDLVWPEDSYAPFPEKEKYSENVIGTIFDFSYLDSSIGDLNVTFEIVSESSRASRNVEFRFAEIDSFLGVIDDGLIQRLPGDAGYKQALKQNYIDSSFKVSADTVKHQVTLEAGKIYTPVVKAGERLYLPFDDFNPSHRTDRRFAFESSDATSFLFESSRVASLNPDDGLFRLISVEIS